MKFTPAKIAAMFPNGKVLLISAEETVLLTIKEGEIVEKTPIVQPPSPPELQPIVYDEISNYNTEKIKQLQELIESTRKRS